MIDVGYGAAFLAGLLSFFSPCVLPIVPFYLSYMAGVGMSEISADGTLARGARLRLIASAIMFSLGMMTIFAILGAGAFAISELFKTYIDWFRYAAGIIVLIMGLHFLGVFRIAMLYREARVQVARKPAGFAGAYVMGLAFAFGWTPCIGPVLGPILTLAGGRETVGEGALPILPLTRRLVAAGHRRLVFESVWAYRAPVYRQAEGVRPVTLGEGSFRWAEPPFDGRRLVNDQAALPPEALVAGEAAAVERGLAWLKQALTAEGWRVIAGG